MKRLSAEKTAEIKTLIPFAVQHVDNLLRKKKVSKIDECNDFWNRAYHSEMDTLTKAAGLRV